MEALRRFEGPTLDQLLEHVHRECGAGSRIVEANRVRRGGFAGFFTREAFEVVVEPELDPTVPRDGDEVRPAPNLPHRRRFDVTEEEDDELVAELVGASLAGRALVGTSATLSRVDPADQHIDDRITERFDELVDAVIDGHGALAIGPARRDATGAAGTATTTVTTSPERPADDPGPDGEPTAGERFGDLFHRALSDDDPVTVTVTDDGPPDPDGTDHVGTGTSRSEAVHAPGQADHTTIPDDRHDQELARDPATEAFHRALVFGDGDEQLRAVQRLTGVDLRALRSVDPSDTGHDGDPHPAEGGVVRLLHEVRDLDRQPSTRSPAPATPPAATDTAAGRDRSPGTATTSTGTVVVVGEASDALIAAERLALDGGAGARVVLASHRGQPVTAAGPGRHPVATSIEDVLDHAERRPRDRHRLVVALDLGRGPSGLVWARRVLAALQADAVHLTVRADDDPADVRATLSLLGGADVVHVTDHDHPVGPLRAVDPDGAGVRERAHG